ncbi:cation diffusion facilitator family transporter [Clostridium sediminicola]|uniref:cation diffusion facilitator family transporter n=1 Tax=Clostridium sediminicola TaxID=3114879 RepID=UPI0031F1FD40
MTEIDKLSISNKIGKTTIVLNLLLAFVKITIGYLGKSAAVVADGFHSLSDIFTTIGVVIGIKYAVKPEDKEHPYGHEKIEPLITKILAIFLFVTAIFIFYNSILNINNGNYPRPLAITLFVAALSVIIKEWMYRYTKKGGKLIGSSALVADAWHHRADAFSSIGVLLGAFIARYGHPIFDPIVSIIISIIIIKIASKLFLNSANELMDCSADDEAIDLIVNYITNVEGVIKIDDLKTRKHGNKLYVDVEISVNKNTTFCDAHNIAETVHVGIENNIDTVKHCMVHVNPF